jgi:hypothetical protein
MLPAIRIDPEKYMLLDGISGRLTRHSLSLLHSALHLFDKSHLVVVNEVE